jgi:hypothetical protein
VTTCSLHAPFQKNVGILFAFFGIIPYRFLKDVWLFYPASVVFASWKLLFALLGTFGRGVTTISSTISKPLLPAGKSVLKVIYCCINIE